MTWQDQLKGDSLSWLSETETPEVRYLALRDLLDCAATDPELRAACIAAHKEGPIATILGEMDKAGFWVKPGPGYNPKYRSTVWSVILLAQLGASVQEDKRIAQACAYLLDHALTAGGQFTISGAPSRTVDCLQGNLSWALLELGYDDPRLEIAFDWMARSVTGEGIAPSEEREATVRYYAGKCGPTFACGANNRLPCAWGGTKVMLALGKWPKKRCTPIIERAIQQGVDFLLSVDPAKATYPTGFSNKPSQNWWKFGFPIFYVTDLLQVVEALVVLGYGNDPRLSRALAIIREKQDENGRWALDYEYTGKTWVDFGAKKQPNKWVTLRALRMIKAIGAS
ncbi:MAG: nitrogen fixation protein NifH [Chloroflexi bacterium]|nr:MAG: nitrogen fixation protein NifH [Chloroflexota bacterium]